MPAMDFSRPGRAPEPVSERRVSTECKLISTQNVFGSM